jgi:adducin
MSLNCKIQSNIWNLQPRYCKTLFKSLLLITQFLLFFKIRSPENKSFFLINPFGLNFEEVTAASLVKVDSTGNIKEKGNTPFGINKAGFILHSAIHSARPDVNCVLHVHTNAGAAVSALKKGLLPISQEALLPLSNVSYHAYDGVLNEEKFRLSIAKSLGQKNKILILNNHGIVSMGATVEEAWTQLFGVLYG